VLSFAWQERTLAPQAAKPGSEPTPEVLNFRSARSEHEVRRDCIIFIAAARREERPFRQTAANLKPRIY